MVPASLRPPLTIVFERERPGVRSQLTSHAAKLGVELVLRSGITDDDLVRLYGASVATICTASVEPFGLTTVESLAIGTPVVAVCEGGYREVVQDGNNGYLTARDSGSLARAIERVLSVPDRWDPEELRASVLPFFSWDAAGSRIDGVFCDVAAGRQPVGALVPRR